MAGADIDLARDGLVDDGPLLFLQQRDQLLLGVDVASDASVGMVEKADDRGLFLWRWEREWRSEECFVGQLKARDPDPF